MRIRTYEKRNSGNQPLDKLVLTAAGETIEEVELAMNNYLLRIKEWLLAKN